MSVYSTEAIIEKVKQLTGDRFDSDLALRLGVSRQSFSQYKNKSTVDLQQRLISLLLDRLEATEATVRKS
jgi:transcriptional regulator with XRE-family HTH domain